MGNIGRRISQRMPPIAVRDLAAEIVRRAVDGRPDKTLPYVVGLSEPPTPNEQLLLAACRLTRQPIAIMPAKCDTVEEWGKRNGALDRASS
jgi:hypothetical protein